MTAQPLPSQSPGKPPGTGRRTLVLLVSSASAMLAGIAFVLLRGCLHITRQRAGEPASYCLHSTPRAPIIIVNPGTYTIVAERSALGLRGVRRRA